MEHRSASERPGAQAGYAAARLIASPETWIHRRVETIELLTHEETRRRVSIDFTLSPAQQRELMTPDGVVVPITVLTKEARRNFDLCDESGRAVPALSKRQNGDLVLSAVVDLARRSLDAAGVEVDADTSDGLVADFSEIVTAAADRATARIEDFAYDAEHDDPARHALWRDPELRGVLSTLAEHYVLFAVLAPEGPSRRILKYSYGDDFDLAVVDGDPSSPWARAPKLAARIWRPDRRLFAIACPSASRAASFHVEVAIPEELRICQARLRTPEVGTDVSHVDRDVNRASLYASRPLEPRTEVIAFVEVTAERSGHLLQAALTSVIVALLLWAGVASGLSTTNPGAAVSIVLAGTALYSGFTASSGQHRLVRTIFASRQRWLLVTTLASLTGSATLALEYPCASPIGAWTVAAVAASAAALRLTWSTVRAPA